MNNIQVNIKNMTQKVFGGFKKKDKTKKGSGKEFIATLSKGLMLPIAMLPIAGLFLGIGAAIVTNAGTNDALTIFGNFLKMPGDVIFGALPVLFAIAIAIAFTKDSGPAALSALVGFLVFSALQAALLIPVKVEGSIIGYNLMFYTDGSLGKYSQGFGLPKYLVGSVLGINQLSSSVFGGFLVGFIVAFLYNKFKNIQLPSIIGFFSGIRFIPIVTFLSLFPITILFLILWPLFGILFYIIGEGLGGGYMYGFNSFIFGYIERALVPFGVHHAFYSPLWYSAAGGTLDLNGLAIVSGQTLQGNVTWLEYINANGIKLEIGVNSIQGDQNVFAFLNTLVGREVMLSDGSKAIIQFSDFTSSVYNETWNSLSSVITAGKEKASIGVNVGQYMQGKYPFMMFGLPAASLAMVMAAPKENRKMSASITISAGLTSFLTGITEPIEFTFLFLAPWLFWGVHASLCALSFGFMNWFGLMFPSTAPHIGMTFSGGTIDWVIYGGIQIPGGSNAWWALILGAIYAPIYYFTFYFLIKKFDIATPGRGNNTKLFTKSDFLNKKGNTNNDNRNIALNIIDAYGGVDNIRNVDACITKLRISINDQSKVDEARLTNDLGAMGVIRPSKTATYSIYGAKADLYKNEINDILKEIENNPSLKDDLFKDIKNIHVESETNNEKSSEKLVIYAPVDCKVVPMEEIPDKTFSEGIVGEGVGIIPKSKEFYSILKSGEMELVFNTGHAYTFKSKEGTQILMHIGIDSINLKNENGKEINLFKPLVKDNQKLTSNTKIVEVNNTNLKKYAKSNITPIFILNDSIKGRSIAILANGDVKKGTPLFEIK